MSSLMGQPYAVTKEMFLKVKEQELTRLGIIGPTSTDYVYGFVFLTNPKHLDRSPESHTIIMGIKHIVCDDIKDAFILKLMGEEKVMAIINEAYMQRLQSSAIEVKSVTLV